MTISLSPLYDWIKGAQLMVSGTGMGTIAITSDAGGRNTTVAGSRACFSVPVSATSG